MKNIIAVIFFLLCPLLIFGHSPFKNDTIAIQEFDHLTFKPKQLIIPATFFAYGLIALKSDFLKDINLELREEVNENIDEKFTIDDFSQFVPALSVYGLNALGIHGRSNLRDRSMIMATAYLLSSGLSLGIKSTTKVERPDGTSHDSFPSGHTTAAFTGAEFLWQEYKDENIWYGISGFAVATGTGIFRIINGRHWFSDVVMGAGIGILSTKTAYWVFPFVNDKIFKFKNDSSALIVPFCDGKRFGIGVLISLN